MNVPIWCIPWYTPTSEMYKLMSCKNLIEYYLGDYLKERQLSLDQISVNVVKGTGTVSNIDLDCAALKKLSTKNSWPVEIVKGYMKDITVRIPWTNIFKRDTNFKITGLSVTVQPTVRNAPVSSILKWVFSNWSEHKHYVVEDKQNEESDLSIKTQPTEFFIGSINSILKRLSVTLEDTSIRIEHMPTDIDRGIALTININKINYSDDTTSEPVAIGTDESKKYIIYAYPRKKVTLEGITLLTDEYTKHDHCPGQDSPRNERSTDFYGTTGSSKYGNKTIIGTVTAEDHNNCYEDTWTKSVQQSLFASAFGDEGVTLSFNYTDKLNGPRVEAEIPDSIVIMLSPKQLDTVIEIIDALRHPNTL